MSLDRLTLKPTDEPADPHAGSAGSDEIETRAMRLLCRLEDETSKALPDNVIVSHILQDLSILVADYRQRGEQ